PPATCFSPLSLHDALPIWLDSLSTTTEPGYMASCLCLRFRPTSGLPVTCLRRLRYGERSVLSIPSQIHPLSRATSVVRRPPDGSERKSTRLNSSHVAISYA